MRTTPSSATSLRGDSKRAGTALRSGVLSFLLACTISGCSPDDEAIVEVPEIRRVSLLPISATMSVGQALQFSGSLRDRNNLLIPWGHVSYRYSSRDSTIAAVASDGRVTARRPGNTSIIVTIESGQLAESPVLVTAAAASR